MKKLDWYVIVRNDNTSGTQRVRIWVTCAEVA